MFAAGNLLLALLLYSVVLADETVVISKSCLDSIAIQDLRFDSETWLAPYAFHAACSERAEWSLDTTPLREFATNPFRLGGISDNHDAHQIDGLHEITKTLLVIRIPGFGGHHLLLLDSHRGQTLCGESGPGRKK